MVLTLRFAIDDAHRHILLIAEPFVWAGHYDPMRMQVGETDLYLELRGADGSTLQSVKIPPTGFVIIEGMTDYDMSDTLNSQNYRLTLDPRTTSAVFLRATPESSEVLNIYMKREGSSSNDLRDGQVPIDELGTYVGSEIDVEALCAGFE